MFLPLSSSADLFSCSDTLAGECSTSASLVAAPSSSHVIGPYMELSDAPGLARAGLVQVRKSLYYRGLGVAEPSHGYMV